MTYAFWADVVALVHGLYVLFVVGGQACILAGWARGWSWTRNPWFRWLHLAAIGIVVLEVILGVYCPLTLLESWLRAMAGQMHYTDSFIGYWVGRLIYYEVALWQAHVAYVVFGALVLWSFITYPPRGRSG